MSQCKTCVRPACSTCDDPYGAYSLVGQSWLNDVTGFGPDCPQGFICGPVGPTPDEPPWDPPPNPGGDGGNDPGGGGGSYVELQGCESTITRDVPAGTTDAQYNAILLEMLQERHDQQVRCDEVPGGIPVPPPPVYRSAEYCLECPDGGDVTYVSGIIPPGLFIESGRLCTPSGSFSGVVSQEEVDLMAAQFVNNSFASLEDDGIITCDQLWIFNQPVYHNFGGPCPTDPPESIPGVTSAGFNIAFHVDTSLLCTTGVISLGLRYWAIDGVQYYKDFGPFEEDRAVSVDFTFSGSISGSSVLAAAFHFPFVVVYFGLTSTPQQFQKIYVKPAGTVATTVYNEMSSIAGTLPAGEILRVITQISINGYFADPLPVSFHHTDGTVNIAPPPP